MKTLKERTERVLGLDVKGGKIDIAPNLNTWEATRKQWLKNGAVCGGSYEEVTMQDVFRGDIASMRKTDTVFFDKECVGILHDAQVIIKEQRELLGECLFPIKLSAALHLFSGAPEKYTEIKDLEKKIETAIGESEG